jgi:hypothetical protein
MEEENQMDLIMGIGPTVPFSADVKKTVRVGTVKQVREVAELYKEGGLLRIKPSISLNEGDEQEKAIAKWLEILSIICIEGFTREEFEDSIPELLEAAVERFLFGK